MILSLIADMESLNTYLLFHSLISIFKFTNQAGQETVIRTFKEHFPSFGHRIVVPVALIITNGVKTWRPQLDSFIKEQLTILMNLFSTSQNEPVKVVQAQYERIVGMLKELDKATVSILRIKEIFTELNENFEEVWIHRIDVLSGRILTTVRKN